MRPALRQISAALGARWQGLNPRERGLVAIAGTALLLALLWLLAIAPAWRTLREAPAQIEQLELQLAQMRRLAAEARELRGAAQAPAGQTQAALKVATERLGDRARLSLQGNRAVLSFAGIHGESLRAWIGEARSGARARVIEAQFSRSPGGLNGTITVAWGPGS